MSASALVCPGQGSQRVGGVADLPTTARAVFVEASEIVGVDLWALGRDGPDEQLARPSLLQPFLVAWARAEIEAARDRTPELDAIAYLLGHSSGENSALVLSGAAQFADAVRFAQRCGANLERACEETPGGLLALAGADRATAEAIAAEAGAVLANHNAEAQTVLGGARPSLQRAAQLAAARKVEAVELRVVGAFHTPAFAQADAANASLIDELPLAEPFTPLIGNAAGQLITDAAAIRAELHNQYSRPIEWVSALQTAYDRGVRTFVTLGPGNAMTGLVRRFARGAPQRVRFLRLLSRVQAE